MENKLVTKIINFILNIYSNIYNFNVSINYSKNEFEYINVPISDEIRMCWINWTYLYSDIHDNLFENYLAFLGLEYDFPTFILSFLHEVGHHKVGDVKNYSNMIMITLYKNLFNINRKEDLDLLVYYNMPDECEASKWAVNFINKHHISLTVLYYILYPFLNYAYKKYWNLLFEESEIYTFVE